MNDLQFRVLALLERQVWYLRTPVLTPDTRLVEDLHFDALDRIHLGLRLEYGLAIAIPDAELDRWMTIADVLAGVARCVPAPLPAPPGGTGANYLHWCCWLVDLL